MVVLWWQGLDCKLGTQLDQHVYSIGQRHLISFQMVVVIIVVGCVVVLVRWVMVEMV